MRTSSLLIISFLLLMLMIPCANALPGSIAVDIEQDYWVDIENLNAEPTITFTFGVYNYNYSTTRDWYIGYRYGIEYENYSGISVPTVERCIIGREFNDSRRIPVTGGGRYNITLDADDIPFMNAEYVLYVVLYSVDANDNKLNDTYAIDYLPFTLSQLYSGDGDEILQATNNPDSIYIAVRDAYPSIGNANSANVVNEYEHCRVTMWNPGGAESQQLMIATGSGNTYPYTLEGWGLRTVNYNPDDYVYSDYEMMFFQNSLFPSYRDIGTDQPWYYHEGISWDMIISGQTLTNASVWHENRPYCWILGVPCYDGPNGNQHITDEDDVYLSCDDTMSYPFHLSAGFTIGYSPGAIKGDWDDTVYDYDIYGYYSSFQTFGGEGWWFTQSSYDHSWGSMIRSYGDRIGMPWFWALITFVIIAIFTCIPLVISFRYDLHLPNILYAVFLIIGVMVTFYLGLLELWMMALFLLAVIIAVISKYHETIENFYTKVRGKEEPSEKLEVHHMLPESLREHGTKSSVSKSVGRWVADRTKKGGYRYER